MSERLIENIYIVGAAALIHQADFVREQKGKVFPNGREIITIFQRHGIAVGEPFIIEGTGPMVQVFPLQIVEPLQYLGEIYVRDIN